MDKEEFEQTKELRLHLSQIVRDKINHIHHAQTLQHSYLMKIKSWCLTLFMIAVGFSLKSQDVLNGYTYFLLPVIPVLLFWTLHSYMEYFKSIYPERYHLQLLQKHLISLLSYSNRELEQLVEDHERLFQGTWEKKGQNNLKRFITKKTPGILKSSIGLINLLFFGGMIFSWVLFWMIQKFVK